MAAFSKSTFDAAAYLAFRPSYPKWVHDKVLSYHFNAPHTASSSTARAAPTPTQRSRSALAIDLGCGPGISTLTLLPHFDRVVGIDPSSKMVGAAIRADSPNLPDTLRPNVSEGSKGRLGLLEYKEGFSEDMPFLAEESVDLVTSGQAAHWFDYPRFWKEITRILKPGGSVCLYGYPDFFLPDFPSTRPLLDAFAIPPGDGAPPESEAAAQKITVDSVRDYWEQPGRSIVSRCFNPIPLPTAFAAGVAEKWDPRSAVKRVYSTQGLAKSQIWPSWPALASDDLPDSSLSPEVQAEIKKDGTLDKTLTWDTFGKYLRTWSSVNTYLGQHPNDAEAHGGQDVVDRFLAQLRAEITRANNDIPVESVLLRWPLCFVMIKKKDV